MNYSKIYDSLILNAQSKNRAKGSGDYYERHHIIPRCLGGTNALNNLVLLTAKEHFIAHHLLIKIYKENASLKYAFLSMCYKTTKCKHLRDYSITSVVYENIKMQTASITKYRMIGNSHNKGYKPTPELIEKKREMMSGEKNPFYGKKHTEYSRKKISNALTGKKGRKHSEITKSKISIANKGMKTFLGKTHSDETKEKMRNAAIGKPKSEEMKMKLSAIHKGKTISEQQRKNHSKCIKGRKCFTDGTKTVMAYQCPEGFLPGRAKNKIS